MAAVDGRRERTVVGDDGEPAGRDDLVGRALAGEHAVEDLPGQLVVERARVDQRLDPGHVGRGDRQLGELDALLVGAPGQLAEPPLAGRRVRGAGRDGLLDQAERAGADGVAHLEVGEAPLLPAAACAAPRGGSGSVARSSSTHSRRGATGTRSGSGK